MTDEQIVSWLEERRANCIRIARLKKDRADRDGWLEDACYFHAAIEAITKPVGELIEAGLRKHHRAVLDAVKELHDRCIKAERQRDDLADALREFSEFVHASECSTDGPVLYDRGHITAFAYKFRNLLARLDGEGGEIVSETPTNESGPAGTYGCACVADDAGDCMLFRYGYQSEPERCECLCHQWRNDDGEGGEG